MNFDVKMTALLETDVDQGTRMIKDDMKKLMDALILPVVRTTTVIVEEENGEKNPHSIKTVLMPEWAYNMLRAASAVMAARSLLEMKKDGEISEKDDASPEETPGENIDDGE